MKTQETMTTSDLDHLFSVFLDLSLPEIQNAVKSRPTYRKGGINVYIAYLKYALESKVYFSAVQVDTMLRVHSPSVRASFEKQSGMASQYSVFLNMYFAALYLICKVYGLKLVVTSKPMMYSEASLCHYSPEAMVRLDIEFGSELCRMLNIKQDFAKHVWTFKENLPWQPNQEHVQ